MKRKKILFVLITVFISMFLSAISAEVLLRLAGYRPWRYHTIDLNEPTVHEPDSILGWQNKEGEYIFTSFSTGGQRVKMTFLKGGIRYSGSPQIKEHNDVVFIGCSFTQGWSVSDHETFASKIQKKITSLNVLNYGTGGYGTYQSLLRLERLFRGSRKPKLVIYGFISHHQIRNLALSNWAKYLSQFSKRTHVYIPYATLDDSGELKRHPPEGYGPWPLRESLALVTFMQDIYMKQKDRFKFSRVREVTEKIILEMDNLCKNNNSKFTVALLQVDTKTKSHFIKFFREQNINFAECDYPLTDDMVVPGENHPNGKMNSLWADCITQAIGN